MHAALLSHLAGIEQATTSVKNTPFVEYIRGTNMDSIPISVYVALTTKLMQTAMLVYGCHTDTDPHVMILRGSHGSMHSPYIYLL